MILLCARCCKVVTFWGNPEGVKQDEASLAEAGWKAGAKEGNSPVSENGFMLLVIILKYDGERKSRRNLAGLLCQS